MVHEKPSSYRSEQEPIRHPRNFRAVRLDQLDTTAELTAFEQDCLEMAQTMAFYANGLGLTRSCDWRWGA